ncbi:MAG: TAXI family TRAP transporter solute-binding subunit [Dethiobacter sp.]|nr:TAXI family TRAP transporter solute-binding subunit [Dethiobacter sp.]
MKKNMKKMFILFLVIGLFLIITSGCSKPAEPGGNGETKLPTIITTMSYDVGTYPQIDYIGERILEKHGISLRIIPSSTAVARHYPVRLKEAEMAMTGVDGWLMQEGIYEYSDRSWGPQPIRIIWFGTSLGFAPGVTADSNIHTVADLKGARIATYVGADAITLYKKAYLAFANIDIDDVKLVPVSGLYTPYDMALAGDDIVFLAMPQAFKATEMAASPRGIRYLELPHDDLEGWARLKAVHPEMVPYTFDWGAGIDKPLQLSSASSPRILTYDWLDDEIAYFMTKVIHEEYDVIAAKDLTFKKLWDMDTNLHLFKEGTNPFHPGTIRYLKEINVWTDELEVLQQERLQRQEDLKKLWVQVTEEADKKVLKAGEFPPFWLEKRAAAGF